MLKAREEPTGAIFAATKHRAFEKKVNTLLSQLQNMPADEFDYSLSSHIRENWLSIPKALQVLEIHDCVEVYHKEHKQAAQYLMQLLEMLMEHEGTNMKELANRAMWRDQDF